MIAYASRTGTRRNLAALREVGWRLLVSATGVQRTEGFRYAIDNGAWTAHQLGQPFREGKFRKVVRVLGPEADFVVLPDIVAGGRLSLAVSLMWYHRLKHLPVKRWLLPVQDGMQVKHVLPHLHPRVGLFVGGSTPFKEGTLAAWGALARERHLYLHVGRVNTARRIALCHLAGAHSFDGTSASRYVSTLPLLERARAASL